MSVRIIEGKEIACLYDSTSGVAFGPVFTGLDAYDQATHFVWWMETQNYDPPLQGRCDIRQFTGRQIAEAHAEWVEEFLDDEHGELTAVAARKAVTLL